MHTPPPVRAKSLVDDVRSTVRSVVSTRQDTFTTEAYIVEEGIP